MVVHFRRRLVGIEARFQALVHSFGRRSVRHFREFPDVGLLAGLGDSVVDHMSDALLGRARRHRQFVVVAVPAVRVGQDPACMIDEAQRLFHIALPVAGLGVVLADKAAQARPHVLVRGSGKYAQGFV